MRVGLPIRILAAAAALALGLTGLVAREDIARDQGQEVRLALAGYDPRSLLQGHYVRFALVEERPTGSPCPPGADGIGGRPKDWVALKRAGDHHVAAGAAATRAQAARLGEIVVRGHLTCFGVSTGAWPGGVRTREVTSISLDLHVDRIHLDQRQAQALQADLQRGPRGVSPGYAVLSIGRDDRARVRGLIVGARRVDLDWF